VFLGTWAYSPKKREYFHDSAVLGGLFFSIFLTLNIVTISIVLGCNKIVKMMVEAKVAGFCILLSLPFAFIYFSCIHKKKYLKILECFSYMDKNWKKRILSAIVIMLYVGISIFLFAWSCEYLHK